MTFVSRVQLVNVSLPLKKKKGRLKTMGSKWWQREVERIAVLFSHF